LRACSNYFKKQISVRRKRTRGQNCSEGVQRKRTSVQKKPTNVQNLETYQRLAIERPATNIISYLLGMEGARHTFNLGEGIIFENHANTLSDNNNEVQQSLQKLRILNKDQISNLNPNRDAPIRFVYTRRQMVYGACVWSWNTNRLTSCWSSIYRVDSCELIKDLWIFHRMSSIVLNGVEEGVVSLIT